MTTTTVKVKTPKAILSFPHLDEPQAGMNGGKPKYSCALIFPAGTDLTELKAAAFAAGEAKFGAAFVDGVKKKRYKWPLRAGEEKDSYPEGSTFINVRSEQQPGVVTAFAGPDGKPQVIPANKVRSEMYPGAIVRASLTAFAYDRPDSKGVTFGLNNLQKLAEGERLDSRVAAENDFDADLSAAPADISSLI